MPLSPVSYALCHHVPYAMYPKPCTLYPTPVPYSLCHPAAYAAARVPCLPLLPHPCCLLLWPVQYMAPELFNGLRVNESADVYSLGCIMYECLTRKVPFEELAR